MQIRVEQTGQGFALAIEGPAWRAAPCQIRFPTEVWQSFPDKEMLTNELAYALTMVPPLLADHPTVWYDTPEPVFFDFYNDCFEQSIPNLVEPLAHENAEDLLDRFRAVGRHFPAPPQPPVAPLRTDWLPQRVVVPFSFGKDSLLTIATLQHSGYEVIPVLIDERVLPRGQAHKEKLCHRLQQELNITCRHVINEIQLLSDYQVLGHPETRLAQVHIHFVYLLAMLPFCFHYRAPLIAFNNEFHHSLNLVHRNGYLLPRKFMQSRTTTAALGQMADRLSNSQVGVINLLGGLGDFAIHRLLHNRFPDYGDFRISCHLETTDQPRWCHKCHRCARAFLFFLASGQDPFAHGFNHSMLSRDQQGLFYLFAGQPRPEDSFRIFMQGEEQLAFSLARQHGATGDLIDALQKTTPPLSAKARQQRHAQFLSLQAEPGPSEPEQQAATLYSRWLSKDCREESE